MKLKKAVKTKCAFKRTVMQISLSTWMMTAFIIFLILGVWEIYAFLPTKQLADDDKTQEAQIELMRLILKVIEEKRGDLTTKELFFLVQEDKEFDGALFWRFNHNRLNQLLNSYYARNPNASCVKDIYKENNA